MTLAPAIAIARETLGKKNKNILISALSTETKI